MYHEVLVLPDLSLQERKGEDGKFFLQELAERKQAFFPYETDTPFNALYL